MLYVIFEFGREWLKKKKRSLICCVKEVFLYLIINDKIFYEMFCKRERVENIVKYLLDFCSREPLNERWHII